MQVAFGRMAQYPVVVEGVCALCLAQNARGSKSNAGWWWIGTLFLGGLVGVLALLANLTQVCTYFKIDLAALVGGAHRCGPMLLRDQAEHFGK